MMQIVKNPNFDFVGKRRIALYVSTVVNIAILLGLVLFGLNLGVDFAGGTLIEVKFDSPVTAQQVREGATRGGLAEPQVQGIGSDDDHSFILRMGGTTQLTDASRAAAEAALRGAGEVMSLTGDLDNGLLNVRYKAKVDPAALKTAVEATGLGVKELRELGQSGGGFDYQVVSSGMSEKVQQALKAGLPDASFQVQRVDYVGPQVGKQLRNKGIMAVLYAMLAIVLYVAFRFDMKFGPGAIVSMLHDIVMVVGYYLVTRREFNLTSIAVLLTIIGYSINDTIVVYDRIREEMVKFKGKPFAEIVNISINSTISRTILTSLTTALSLLGLLFFTVGEIFDFAAAMLVGIVVGTYSSMFIASPLVIWMESRESSRGSHGASARARTA